MRKNNARTGPNSPKYQHMLCLSSSAELDDVFKLEYQSSILSLNSSRCCRALRPGRRSHSNHLVPLCRKKRDKILINPLWLKVESKVSKITRALAVVHAKRLYPCSHIISVQSWICHLRSETLRVSPVLPHPPDQCNFSITFPPFLLCCNSDWSPCASQTPNLRREGGNTDSYSQHFIQGKRNASSIGMRLSTPSIDPTMFPREEI